MQLEITTLYCLCDDFLTAYGHKDDLQAQMTPAEGRTTARAAASCYGGKQETIRIFLKEHGYIAAMLSKSRFNRRLHQIPDTL